METLLGGWGCRVLKAADLAEALAAIERSGLEPDGLLVDYHLDGGNGVVAIAELRRRHGRDLPAILITADRSLHVREEARAAGVHVLNKPVKPASLARADHAVAGATRGGGVIGSLQASRRRARCGHWPASILPAAMTAWVRLSTPSFCRMAETCAFTVASETPSS